MMTLSTATCLLLLLAAQTPPPAAAPPRPPAEPLEVQHVPPAQVPAGTELVLRAQVAPVWRLGTLVVHHRVAGQTDWRDTAFELSAEGTHAAVIPVPAEQRQPLEYYLTARDTDGVETVRFASADAPHAVLVEVPSYTLEREAQLEATGHRRSRVSAFAEFVNYGTTTLEGTRYADRYYRLEADYLYRLYTPAGGVYIDSIRIGVGHLRASTPPFEVPVFAGAAQPQVRPGLDYGFSEVDVGFHPNFGLGLKLVLGGNASGFAAGVGGKVRIGRPQGARGELEGEYVGGLGGSATFRLAWDTVPRFPMSAAVQVTNVPSGPVGVRLLYRADYQVSDALLIGVQAGYQARTSLGGGPTLGLVTSYGW